MMFPVVFILKILIKEFQNNKHGNLYVGESRRFPQTLAAYQPRDNGKLTELETKLQRNWFQK